MLFANRWEQLLGMRDRIDQVQVLAWNDYGESIYLNDIRGDMPPDAKLYATNVCEFLPLAPLSTPTQAQRDGS